MSDDKKFSEYTDEDYEALKARVRVNADKIKSHIAYEAAASYADAAMEKHKDVVSDVDPETVFALRTLIIGAFLGGFNTFQDTLRSFVNKEGAN